jgi:hypothetical protein
LKRHETQKQNYTLRGNAIGDKKIEIDKMDKELKQKEIQMSYGGMYCWRLYDVLKTWKKNSLNLV